MSWRCPECGSSQNLFVVVSVWAKLLQESDGNFQTVTDEPGCPDHDHEWDEESSMYCQCGHIGTYSDFEEEL